MGFESEKFIGRVSDDQKCCLCHDVLDNPVKTPCVHVFCSGCILPWVVRHGVCPHKCRALTHDDLETVLPLRAAILNMNVRCEFVDRGCQSTVRLTDLVAHTLECDYRLSDCRNTGCSMSVNHKDLSRHESEKCAFRAVGICQKGCGLVLLQNTASSHDCIEALKAHIAVQELNTTSMELEMKRQLSKFNKREKSFLAQITTLHSEIQIKALKFQQKLKEYRNHLLLIARWNCTEQFQEEARFTVSLQRDSGSLGFNIVGGSITQEKNSGTVSEGIVVSRITERGPAEKTRMKIHDQIIQVNGQDLSKSTHEEAVAAFRTAQEPIIVEVLRRVNKTKMKSRGPTLVSIATQTEDDDYGLHRPPTPPPGYYGLENSGLYQPSSRRPVALSPSAEMGLTDIELANGLEYDESYFDERTYEMEYEEVVLQRMSSEDKLGLTLCYGSLEDEITEIFISEIEPYSIAAKDGRIREGDQILQINGVNVQCRDQAIHLFSQPGDTITLVLARPQLQLDDGFIEEHNVLLDDLHLDLLDQHQVNNMQFLAGMLGQGNVDEEGGTTDTATTENSSHKHEKDSGVGRTDESTKNDESSEQENFDNECNSPGSNAKFSGGDDLHYSNESFSSNEVHEQEFTANEISTEECDKFREVLENRCSSSADNSPKKQQPSRKKCTNNIETEVAQLNKEMEDIQLECQGILEAHMKEQMKVQLQQREALKTEPQRSPRIVPRMGTRLEYLKYIQAHDISVDWKCKEPQQSSPVSTQNAPPGTVNSKDATNVSANVSGENCRSAPLTLELSQVSDGADKGFKNSMLCLAPVDSSNGYVSDTEKQTQTPTKSSDYIIDMSVKSATNNGLQNAKPTLAGQENQAPAPNHIKPEQVKMGESLQDLYMQYSDIMYTNRANLQHTIAVQQKLFQQQMDQKSHLKRKKRGGSKSGIPESPSNAGSNQMGSDSNPMEWVVKRRPDGTRYVTRRPIRNRILKERAKKITEERCGMTTDDDAMSELKIGRYWTKEERKSHMEKSRDQKKRREQQLKAKMETLREADEKKELNIVELSHKKMLKHKGKKVFDDFMTVQEMFSHGSRVQEGKTYNPLLSVTTV